MVEGSREGLSRLKEAFVSMPLSLKLCLLVLIAVIPRLIVFFQSHLITNDGILYIKMAKLFSEGKYGGTPDSYFSLYPLMIFVFQKFTGGWELSGQLISIVLGTLAVIPCFLLGKSLYNEKIGWLSAIFYITLPNLLEFNTQVVRDPTLWFFVLFTMWFVWEGIKQNRPILFGLASFSAGLGAITRVEGFIVFSVLFLYIAFNKIKKISLKRKILNLSLFVLLFPFLLSLALLTFKRSSTEMAVGEMTSFPVKFITTHVQTVLSPLDPIEAMGERNYSSLPMISQYALRLASRHRYLTAVSEVIYKFVKSANFLIILILFGFWKRKQEGFIGSDSYLFYIFAALFFMSFLYARQLYYFSTRHGLTLVLPVLFFAGYGLYSLVEITSMRVFRFFPEWTRIRRYLPFTITVFIVVLFLGQGLSGEEKGKVFIKETGIWLKQKGYEGSLIMGPQRYYRSAFYAEAEFLNLPDSWEKVAETIRQKKVRLILADPSTIEWDCPGFLENWQQAGLIQVSAFTREKGKSEIRIYMIPEEG